MQVQANDDLSGQALRAQMGLLTEDEMASLLGVTTLTLYKWRKGRTGPAHAALGKAIFYRRTDVLEWVQAQVEVRKAAQQDSIIGPVELPEAEIAVAA